MGSTRQHSGEGGGAVLVIAVAALVLAVTLVPAAIAQDELDFLLGDEAKSESAAPQQQSETAPTQAGEPAEPAQREPAAAEAPDADGEPKAETQAVGRRPRVIEEVVVTAQKREQAEIDVPISISVIDADFIAEQGITDLHDISVFVPNTKIHTSAVFPDIRIRGFGTSPLNPVFEQSVGLVLDGIPYGSKAFYQAALFDIERVEVLRGPQGALYGKNVTAGLLNITAKSPTDEATGFVDLQKGDLEHGRLEAGFGGPLLPGLVNFRFAGLEDKRDGYFENTTVLTVPTAPESLGARDREAVRAKFEFPDLVGSKLQLTYEESDSLLVGGYEFRRIPAATRPLFLQFDPNTDFEPDNLVGSIDHFDGIDIGVKTFVANWSYDWGDWGLTAVGGRSVLDEALENDTDFGPTPAAFTLAGRTTTQTTLELRLLSPTLPGFLGLDQLFGRSLGESNFTVGYFSQKRQIDDLFSTLNFNDLLLAEIVLVDQVPVAGPVIGSLIGGLFPQLPLIPATIELLDQVTREQSTIFFDEQAETTAFFGQMDWAFLPKWSLSLGLRVSDEDKQAHIRRRFDTPNSLFFEQVLMWEEFDRRVARSESQKSPKVSLNYQPTDEISLFLSWGEAYKAGGFNAFASGGSDDELTFEPEVVQQWAIDAKTRLLDGAASLNVSVFRMDLDDFQVLTADPGNLRITIENAAMARSQGVEADLTWLPTEWLTLRGTLGYLDTEFLDFPIATCPQDRENSDGDSEPRCDVSGKPLVRAPKWSNTLTPIIAVPLSAIPGLGRIGGSAFDGIGLLLSLTAEYQRDQFLNDDLDERKQQESFYRYRGNIGIGDLNQTWSLRLSAENLTDERTAVAAAELPAVAPGHFYQIPEPGRVVYVHFRANF